MIGKVVLIMKKLRLISLILVCVMLSGCSLIVKDPEVDGARIVITVNGEEMNKKAFTEELNANIEMQKQLEVFYKSYGMQAPAVSEEEIRDNTIDDIVRNTVLKQKAAKLQLDVLSEEDIKQLEKDTENSWNNIKNGMKARFFTDSELEGEELEKALEEKAIAEGYSKKEENDRLKNTLIMEKLRQETIKDVSVTAEEIKAEYDSLVARDEALAKEDPNEYGRALMNRQTNYYAPSGYRMVKQILIKFLDENQTEIDTARGVLSDKETAFTQAESAYNANEEALKEENISTEKIQELNDKKAELKKALETAEDEKFQAEDDLDTALEKGYAAIIEKAQGIYDRLIEGEDFDTLAQEYNEDTGMPQEGYAVRKGFEDFDIAFMDAAMELKKIDDVSKPAKGIYGYYIVYYSADVKEGAIDISKVQEDIKADLLKQKQDETYENAVKLWTDESEIIIDKEAIID